MQSFYKNWLKKNNEENERVRERIETQNQQTNIFTDPIPSTSTDPIPSTSSVHSVTSNLIPSTSKTESMTSDIVYQKDGLQLLVEKGAFQRQKKFSLQAKFKLSEKTLFKNIK